LFLSGNLIENWGTKGESKSVMYETCLGDGFAVRRRSYERTST